MSNLSKNKHMQKHRRRSKKYVLQRWKLSTAWLDSGNIIQFRDVLQPRNSNEWVLDKGIPVWNSLESFKENLKLCNRSGIGRVDQRIDAYKQICMSLDKVRFAQNMTLVQVLCQENVYWVLLNDLRKYEREKVNDMETVS